MTGAGRAGRATVLGVHNSYGAPSGEEAEFQLILSLLEERGHRVLRYERSSAELGAGLVGEAKGFCSGIWNPWSARALGSLVREERPDLCVAQNLFPLISPSVLPVLRRAGVSIVMRVANFRLLCPNGLFFSRGEVCERCAGGREYWCVLRNCERSLPKSLGYAVRSAVARQAGVFQEAIDAYVVASSFLKRKLADAGFLEDRIFVIPNVVELPAPAPQPPTSRYVAFAGRLTPEKGFLDLIEVARALPEIPFRVAGRLDSRAPWAGQLPPNLESCGYLAREDLDAFYRGAAFLLSTSRCYETFGMVVAEAALRGQPAIVSGHGPLVERVTDGLTGIHVAPGDTRGFVVAVRRLWSDPALARRLGDAAQDVARGEYSPSVFYGRLAKVMEFALERAASSTRPA